jgi:hypothetical protein
MKLTITDQNGTPITNPATLPAIEAAVAAATDDVSITHGKGGVPELPAFGRELTPDDVDDMVQELATPENAVAWSAAGASADAEHSSTDEVSDAGDKRLSPRDLMVARLRNIHDRLIAYADNTNGTSSTAWLALMTTAKALDVAIEASAELPPDWKPARHTGTASLVEGANVFLKSKHRALYQSDLSADDMDDMVIMRVGDKRLRCHCVSSGSMIFIPHGHVEKK